MKEFFRKNNRKVPWQIATARYCVDNSEIGFTKDGLEKYIQSTQLQTHRIFFQFF